MVKKPVKKSATKKPVAKKPVAKKAPAKKSVAKKPVAKKTPVMAVATEPQVVVAPVMEHKCGEDCPCHCHGSRFGRFIKWLVIIAIAFVLGYFVSVYCLHRNGPRGPRAQFENGCLVTSSVQCPQMQEMLPVLDTDNDGCITRAEYKAGKKHLRKGIKITITE